MSSRNKSRPRRRVRPDREFRRTFLLVGGVVIGAAVLIALVLAYQTYRTSSALKLAAGQSKQLQAQVANGNVAAARNTLVDLKASTAQAESHSDGMLWNAVRHAPMVGDDFGTIQTVSRVLHNLSEDGLQPIVDAANLIDSNAFSPKNGRVDTDAVKKIAPALDTADKALSTSRSQLAGVKTADLFGPLRGPIRELKSKLDKAQSAASSGAIAARLVPAMLGGSGSRSYLLVFQNNAEIRATGGLPGAFAMVKAKNGKLTLGQQGAATDFDYFDDPPIKLTKDERTLYSGLMTAFFGDSNFTPDFPRTGKIMRAMYKQKFGTEVDGVISVDPIALSYILKGTGPVKTATGKSITSKNAVDQLLNRVYLDYPDDGVAQNVFFADTAKRVFDAVAAGKGNPRNVLAGMTKAVGENRILIWSANKAEQKVLTPTRVSGSLPGDSGSTAHVGVYINDATATKLEYYLDVQTGMHTNSCTKDGIQTIEATSVLTSTVPKKAASLPAAILGKPTDYKPGTMQMNLRVYAPYGGLITNIAVNDKDQIVTTDPHKKRNVTVVPITLKPGERISVRATILSGRHQPDDPILSVTPGIKPTPNNVAVASACRR